MIITKTTNACTTETNPAVANAGTSRSRCVRLSEQGDRRFSGSPVAHGSRRSAHARGHGPRQVDFKRAIDLHPDPGGTRRSTLHDLQDQDDAPQLRAAHWCLLVRWKRPTDYLGGPVSPADPPRRASPTREYPARRVSLVGPRPERPEFVGQLELVIPRYREPPHGTSWSDRLWRRSNCRRTPTSRVFAAN